eukprot:scaffold58429_cov56-Cyclotella_meneghiniana.AAC.2
MHSSFIIGGADLDQCFDRSNAPIAGLAARAHRVSRESTRLMLTTMQNMQYFVRTGFGISKEPAFGGQEGDLLMSLGQGSGAAPMGMRNIITIATNAYKRLGHGIRMQTAISQRLLLLAAIIYVDDTDLLHWGRFYGIDDEEFLADAQAATIDWCMLVQATGGAVISQPKASGTFSHGDSTAEDQCLNKRVNTALSRSLSHSPIPPQPQYLSLTISTPRKH